MKHDKHETSQKSPKIPPCDQYEGPHELYTRKSKKFCRQKTRFKKKTQVGMNYCMAQSKKTIKLWANIFDFKSLSEEKLHGHICSQLQVWKTMPPPPVIIVKKVAQALKIPIQNKPLDEIKSNIQSIILNSYTPTFKRLLVSAGFNDDIRNKHITNYIIRVIHKCIQPNQFSNKTKLDISESYYKELIEAKKQKTIDPSKESILKRSMEKKFDHCYKRFLFLATFLTKLVKKDGPLYNPIEICKYSIYTQRGIVMDKNMLKIYNKDLEKSGIPFDTTTNS
jgi:hypothetical protein